MKSPPDVSPKIPKQQLVSLNGDSIRCLSVENDKALACDIIPCTAKQKTKTMCVHIRENKWYDATSLISVGVNQGKISTGARDFFIFDLHSNGCDISPKGSTSSIAESDDSQSSLLNNLWPLNSSFMKNVFLWKTKDQTTPLSSPSRNSDKIGSSSALIQQPRPPNLPPKSIQEEENHRKQYNEILEAARRREQREERDKRHKREMQLKQEARLARDSQIWTSQILPRFESLQDTKRVRELWWRGLPPSIRGKVWKLAICNNLNITSHLYELCLERAMDNPANDTLASIKLDVSRTFPSLCLFQNGGPLTESLRGILAAYAVYRPDIGYVQGMSFIAAVLALNMDTADAFICFANVLNQPCHLSAFTVDQRQMSNYYKVYSNALANKLPKIYSHFISSGLSPDLYLLDWLYTIYAKAMPLDVTCRIWDVFLRDGEEFLFRAALGVLHLYQEELLNMDFVRGAQFLTKLPDNIQADSLFQSISQMSTTVGTNSFQDMLIQVSSKE